MATKELALRMILQLREDLGASPEKTLDIQHSLSSFLDATPGRMIALAPAAANQALTFTAACALVIVSRDYPFSIRLAADETLITNQRFFVSATDDEDASGLETSVLLTGNGSNTANLEVWIVEMPAS